MNLRRTLKRRYSYYIQQGRVKANQTEYALFTCPFKNYIIVQNIPLHLIVIYLLKTRLKKIKKIKNKSNFLQLLRTRRLKKIRERICLRRFHLHSRR